MLPKSNLSPRAEIATRMMWLARAAAAASALIGAIVLVGWKYDIVFLKSLSPNLNSMKSNTAFAVLLCGLSLWILVDESRSKRKSLVGYACALLVVLIAALSFLETAFHWNFGIDQLLFVDTSAIVRTSSPGRMALNTALCLFLLGLSLLLLDRKSGWRHRPSQFLALAAAILSLVALIGYAYDVRVLYGIAALSSMALHTCFTLLVLSSGILLARPRAGFMVLISRDDAGGTLVRRLLPIAIGLPIIFGWLRLKGQWAGLYGTEAGTMLLVPANIVFLVMFVYIAVSQLNRMVENLRQVHEVSSERETTLRAILESIGDGVVVADENGKFIVFNPAAERILGVGPTEKLIGDWTQTYGCYLPDQITPYPAEDLPLARAIRGESSNATEVFIRNSKVRAGVWISVTGQPLKYEDGTLRGGVVVFGDVTASKRSREHFQKLLEAAPDAMVVVNQGGEIVLLNLQAEKQFGYSRDELLGQKVKNIIPEGFTERLIADGTRTAAEALAQQIGMGIELRGRRKNGSEFPIEIMLSPLESAEGILVTAAIRDISVRKAAEEHLAQMEDRRRLVEEALRESDERYRMLLDGVQDYAIFMMDPRGQVVSWNAGAERIKGYRADEIIGRNFSCFFPPEDVERGRPEEVLRITAAIGSHEEQGMRVRKDGSRFVASVAFTALRDQTGNLRGFSEFSHDLSKSKEAEAKYRGLLEAAPDAIVVVNQGGEIVLLNLQAEKQFGYSRDELLGQLVKQIIPEGFAERLIADGTRTAAEALAQQISTGIELRGRRKNGSEFPIEIMLSPLESAEGILVTAAIRDITERKSSEEHLVKTVGELKRSNDELGQFAYVASHDLQEPLRMVASYTQLLAKRYKGRLDSNADEFIAYAVDGANRMQRMIQDLLAYSRAGANGTELHEGSSESALNEALSNLRGAIEESGAIVTHDLLPTVMTDESQLAQVFQNLVGNAIKYRGAETPHIHVSASEDGGVECVFSVQDNGLGIAPQHFDRIFVIFQRLHGREEFAGTGIGLAICKKIVERQGGRIWVESQPGKGSTFHFALPEREAP